MCSLHEHVIVMTQSVFFLIDKRLKYRNRFNTQQHIHYANIPMQYNATFHGPLNGIFQMEICDIFLIFLIYVPNRDFGCL